MDMVYGSYVKIKTKRTQHQYGVVTKLKALQKTKLLENEKNDFISRKVTFAACKISREIIRFVDEK